jgi:hypothetical protein
MSGLTASGPITITANNQLVENLDITVPLGSTLNGITANGFSNVTIRNCNITHSANCGICFTNCPFMTISRVNIVYGGPQATGSQIPGANMSNPTCNNNNIAGALSPMSSIDNVRLVNGSSGIYLNQCDYPVLTWIKGINQRGPGPRGQLVQFNTCLNPFISDFSNYNDPTNSYPEDCLSFFASPNFRAIRGILDGNNSVSGCGVMAEHFSNGGVVMDVDTINQSNGSIFFYPSNNCSNIRNRTMNSIAVDQGRGKPSSNCLVYGASGCTGNQIVGATVYNLGNPGNVLWDSHCYTSHDIKTAPFTPRQQLTVGFSWGIPQPVIKNT